jgi:hypothetical protein
VYGVLDSVSIPLTEYLAWAITDDRGRPAIDMYGKLQLFTSALQARRAAEAQGRETRHCKVTVETNYRESTGSMADNIDQRIAKNRAARAARPKKEPRPKRELKPELAYERLMAADRRRAKEL